MEIEITQVNKRNMSIVNYILVDLENIQPSNLNLLALLNYRVMVFVGANQNKINFEFVEAMQILGEKAEYIKIEGNGKNALDFHIAFRLGQLSQVQATINYFHIISKDTGFDPLIKFMLNQKMKVQRISCITEIKALKALMATTIEEQAQIVIENLNSRTNGKPKSETSLQNTVKSIFGNTIEIEHIQKIIGTLSRQKYLKIQDDKVSYIN